MLAWGLASNGPVGLRFHFIQYVLRYPRLSCPHGTLA